MKLAILFLTFAALAHASDIPLSPGFEHFYNLEYNDAIREFRAECKANPDDPTAYSHLAQALLYREMFKAGALESELVSGSNSFLRRPKMNTTAEAGREFDNTVAKIMQLSQARLDKDPNDIAALYDLGIAHGLRANYNFLVRKAWMDALRDATTGRKLHNRILEIDPNYVDARLAQGAHDYLIGTLPWHYRLVGFVAGLRGDRDEGIKTLHYVAEHGRYNRYDAQVFLAAIYRRERKPAEAIPLLQALIARFPRNYLLRLEMAQMYADAGEKDKALEVLNKVDELKRSGSPGFNTLQEEKIAFYKGTLFFWYNDLDAALGQMKRVTPKAGDLDLSTAILAWMRIGQIYDMQGRHPQAVDAYKHAIALAPQSDAAKEPRQYIASPYRRAS
jgi:tetratricopeptide (TPR) repeat protein